MLTRDAYLLCNRPRSELLVHIEAYRLGLRVPLPLGAAWDRRGPWYRGRIATLELNAGDLLRYLQENERCDAVLEQCGSLICEMHDKGILHADLQVRNILIAEEGPYLIDFDNARVLERVSPRQRNANLLRLRRSFQKNGLEKEAFEALCRGYGVRGFPAIADVLYRAKGSISDLFSR